MCGKVVGVGLFLSDSLESQSYDFDVFDEIAHIKPLYGVESLHRSFSNRKHYLRNSKISKKFSANFGYVSQIPVMRF